MPKITISGVDARVDGSYDLDLDDVFTGNELHLIKKVAGVRVGEIGDAMNAGDYDLLVALTKIALDRNGRDVPVERLLDAKVGAIQFGETEAEAAVEAEDEQLPLTSASTGPSEQPSDKSSSGGSSSNGSDILPENALPVIGVPASPTGSTSDPTT